MLKIIVQFPTKDGNETLCFKSESCQEWLDGFLKALGEAQVTECHESEAYKEWWKRRPNSFIANNSCLQDWLKEKPLLEWDHAGMFNYCGHEFDVSDFQESDGSEITPPSVYELEDWFQKSCLNDTLSGLS